MDGSTLTPPGPKPLTGAWAAEANRIGAPLGKQTTDVMPFMGAGPEAVGFTGGLLINIGGAVTAVYGAVFAKWTSPGVGNLIGLPVGPEANVDGVPRARWQEFKNGAIVWNPDTGRAHLIYGDILWVWKHLRAAERGMLGFITSDEHDTIPAGRWNSFTGGGIVWRADTGAHPVWGQMARTYLASGGTRGLGFPTKAPENGPANGWVTQSFTNGTIAVKG